LTGVLYLNNRIYLVLSKGMREQTRSAGIRRHPHGRLEMYMVKEWA